ncbi:hypothetical protein MHBO_004952, partial [Bonamia ostreae]
KFKLMSQNKFEFSIITLNLKILKKRCIKTELETNPKYFISPKPVLKFLSAVKKKQFDFLVASLETKNQNFYWKKFQAASKKDLNQNSQWTALAVDILCETKTKNIAPFSNPPTKNLMLQTMSVNEKNNILISYFYILK